MPENNKTTLVVLESSGRTKPRPAIPDLTVEQMKHSLALISPSPWEAELWEVTVPTSQKRANLRFPSEKTDAHDSVLLRALALSHLLQFASPDSAQRVVREAAMFLEFLGKYGVHIENIRNSTVRAYVDRLEHMSIGDAQRNSRIRSAAALYEVCLENNLVTSGERVIDFSYRFSDAPQKKRAPDQCVVDALDVIVLNGTEDIPPVKRLCYFMVRLIPNRISEVLGMDRDCLSYPDLGLFAVRIPTSKETAMHIPVIHDYNFSMAGEIEQVFYTLIQQQRDCLAQLSDADVADSDYLFFDPARGKVISDSDFNQFLAGLISKHRIRNADGSYPVVTSHMFRHVTIGERLRSATYEPEDAMVEANHTSLEMTLSYGYQSERDEAKHLGSIAASVLDSELGVAHDAPVCTAPREISSAKFSRLQAAPFTRVLPGMGLCQNASCHPQYVECIKCSSFNVDPFFLEYFEATREIIQERLETLQKKGATKEAIAFEYEQLEVVNAYIERMTSEAKAMKERRNDYAAG